jgi:hypothetical protein
LDLDLERLFDLDFDFDFDFDFDSDFLLLLDLLLAAEGAAEEAEPLRDLEAALRALLDLLGEACSATALTTSAAPETGGTAAMFGAGGAAVDATG